MPKGSGAASLKDEFDAALLPGLDWEQAYWFSNVFQRGELLRELDVPAGADLDAACGEPGHALWSRFAFFLNTQCPKSAPLSPAAVFKLLSSPEAMAMLGFRDQFSKYSLWAQAMSDPWFTFMNYGVDMPEVLEQSLKLKGAEANWPHAAQMYHRVAAQAPIKGKDVLEVGCGRGGGAAYVARAFAPRSMTGMDGTRSNVKFCARVHKAANLSFIWGKAEALPFENGSFDALINVESYTYYRPLESFISHARRVLRPKGHLLLAGYGPFAQMSALRAMILDAGFSLAAAEDVSAAVRRALVAFRREGMRRAVEGNRTLRSKEMYFDFFERAYAVDVQRYYIFDFKKR
ncbi:MAG: methyltransferase domain-containing protein [Proteobacteria bacterium]|nr:methyltransferase domain-containing protein [Pseudomonadota bacterium]